jgi:altronate hydrolase
MIVTSEKRANGAAARSRLAYKVAARPIAKGEPILKYNVVIGFAAPTSRRALVHSHNVEFREFDRDYAHASDYRPVDYVPAGERATFMGIVRADGRWPRATTSASCPR